MTPIFVRKLQLIDNIDRTKREIIMVLVFMGVSFGETIRISGLYATIIIHSAINRFIRKESYPLAKWIVFFAS